MLAETANTAFDDIANLQRTGDALGIGGQAAKLKGSGTGLYRQPAPPGQVGDDILGDPVAEIVLTRIGAKIAKGQDRDCRPAIGPAVGGRVDFVWFDRLSLHLADETESLPSACADVLLPLTAVANSAARGVDAIAQRRFRYDPSLPDGRQQLVLADHVIAVLDQMQQQVEDLRFEMHRLAVAGQLASRGIKSALAEEKMHQPAPELDSYATIPPGPRKWRLSGLKIKSSPKTSHVTLHRL